MNDRVADYVALCQKLRDVGVLSTPHDIQKLLRAMAGGTEAQANRSDIILTAAADMIAAFERLALEKI